MATIWAGIQDSSSWALATVVRQLRSAPRNAGTMMAVASDGRTLGNVSAGCVDAEVHAAAQHVLATGESRLTLFGVNDDRALSAGLSCGGSIEVVVTPAPAAELVSRLESAIGRDEPVALVTFLEPGDLRGAHLVVGPDDHVGSSGDSALDKKASDAAREMCGVDGGEATNIAEAEGLRCLVQWFLPRPLLLVFGAVAYAEALAALGKLLGYRVIVCDARPVFATSERIPSADEVVVDWPHRFLRRTQTDRRTVVLSLVHDEKFEIPLLTLALKGAAAYVGALGSRKTARRRWEVLRAFGLSERELSRLRAPIGLDLGARTAEETAVSIMGEVIALARGGTGQSLSTTTGAIHSRCAS